MKDLSVIIVNYNVVHFLEQALFSVFAARKSLDLEVFVVDNNSVDDSVAMVNSKYPEVIVIENKVNNGFSKANNQAIKQASGKYILLLNPDTIVQEDTFEACYRFMESTPEAGAVGVRMIDGSGTFLPESKRGFPSPFVAFTKSTGLSKLFPKSKFWNAYHLLYLDEFETNPVDVLCGAFMFLRKECLDKTGLLDEDYFMYGEDIDLSYRIIKSGYKNYYFPKTSIIHFKGESTKKGSLNYVRTFYNAMIIFANKHFRGEGANLLVFFLKLAIWGRASLSFFKRIGTQIFPPLAEGLIFFFVLRFISDLWAMSFYHDPDYYAKAPLHINFILYTTAWILALKIFKSYIFPVKILSVVKAIVFSSFFLLGLYGLLDISFRSSRAILVIGSISVLIFSLSWRLIWNRWKHGSWLYFSRRKKNVLILSSASLGNEVSKVLAFSNINAASMQILDVLLPDHMDWFEEPFDALKEYIRINKVNELIFSVQDLGMEKIIRIMSHLGPALSYKISGDKEMSIIGSPSKNNIGELYTFDIKFQIDQPEERRSKRIFDVLVSFSFLIFFPVLFAFFKNSRRFAQNSYDVWRGKKTWVGYCMNDQKLSDLPEIRNGIVQISRGFDISGLNEADIHSLNVKYAKDFSVQQDLDILLRNWKHLDKAQL